MGAMRIPLLWLWRLLLGGFAICYLASETLQAWLPPLLPFLAAAAVEAQFFFAGLRQGRGHATSAADRGPQPRDLDEFGWATRTLTVRGGDAELVLRPGELGDAEISEWLDLHRKALEALGPGRHKLAPINDAESPVALYAAPPPVARPSKVRRRLLEALAVLALVTAFFFLDRSEPRWQKLPETARAATVTLLDREASKIAGHPAQVTCDVAGRHVGYVQDADGLAEVGGRRMWLTPEVCYRIHRISETRRAAGAASGQAIAVFAHEAWHLHGEARESVANCYAYQSGVAVGQALGLSATGARGLMRQQLADNPSDFATTPQYVVPDGCHRGGDFDLRLDGAHFP
jgi:hypothetical protein